MTADQKHPSIDSFIQRVNDTKKRRGKEVKLSIDEAQSIIFEMTQLLAAENVALRKLVEVQEKKIDQFKAIAENEVRQNPPKPKPKGPMLMDGGSFKE